MTPPAKASTAQATVAPAHRQMTTRRPIPLHPTRPAWTRATAAPAASRKGTTTARACRARTARADDTTSQGQHAAGDRRPRASTDGNPRSHRRPIILHPA
ncbi:MAG: hypothetical protein ACU0A4_00415 [Paracoccaceae bacterium]